MAGATGRIFAPIAADQGLRQQTVHGPFLPADIRGGERFRSIIRDEDGRELASTTLWRLSPYGVEVVVSPPSALGAHGKAVSIQLTLGQQDILQHGHVIDDWREGDRDIVGIRFDRREKIFTGGASQAPETRNENRWKCHSIFFPTGQATSTTRFSDHIRFRVLDISASGMQIATSLRNRMLIPGIVLTARMTFLGSGTQSVQFEVVHCQVKEEASGMFFVLGVRFINPSKKLLSTVGQYILTHGHHDKLLPTPAILRRSGFYLKSVSEAVDYDYVRTEADYKKVCELRAAAVKSVPSLKSEVTPEQMADPFDKKSRILVARFRGEIVGTLRVMFPHPEEKFEDESYCTFPDDLPPRELIAESSRAATHIDFRGTDVFLNLLRYATLVTLQANRRYIVQGTYAALVPVYERIGFKRLNVSFPHPVSPGEIIHLLLIDVKAQVGGEINPFVWSAIVPKIEQLLTHSPESGQKMWRRHKVALYRGVAPVVNLVEEARHFMAERRFLRQRLRNVIRRASRGQE